MWHGESDHFPRTLPRKKGHFSGYGRQRVIVKHRRFCYSFVARFQSMTKPEFRNLMPQYLLWYVYVQCHEVCPDYYASRAPKEQHTVNYAYWLKKSISMNFFIFKLVLNLLGRALYPLKETSPSSDCSLQKNTKNWNCSASTGFSDVRWLRAVQFSVPYKIPYYKH